MPTLVTTSKHGILLTNKKIEVHNICIKEGTWKYFCGRRSLARSAKSVFRPAKQKGLKEDTNSFRTLSDLGFILNVVNSGPDF